MDKSYIGKEFWDHTPGEIHSVISHQYAQNLTHIHIEWGANWKVINNTLGELHMYKAE